MSDARPTTTDDGISRTLKLRDRGLIVAPPSDRALRHGLAWVLSGGGRILPLAAGLVLSCAAADQIAPSPPAAAAAGTRLLTTTREIRALPPAEARRRHPVRLRATVTAFRSSYGSGYFVIDETGPIYVAIDPAANEPEAALEVGQRLEIAGVSDPGTYAPQVRELQRTVVGQVELPPPPRLTYEQIASGGADCQYAEISGIVRRVTDVGFVLAMGAGRVEVACAVYDSGELERLVDARVRLRGVVSGRFNQKRQWVDVRVTVSSPANIVVEKPAPADPYATRTHSVGELLQWELNQAGRHRVKVRGVVTHLQPGEALFIREGPMGLQVQTNETQTLAPGDGVEVLGFPALGTYSAVLEDAVYRRTGRQPLPAPSPATPDALLRGEWDASLVSVRGLLLESVRQHGARVLVMQAGDVIFHARLDLAGRESPLLPAAGSLLELTGIAVVAETFAVGAHLSPRLFSLLLRSTDDIRIVRRASWWTEERLWQALGVISFTALGILTWVWLLRRQVRAQTAALKEQTQRETVLEERTRIARELHDTLDQELTGISLQLHVAVTKLKDDPIGENLKVVHRLLQRSQSEVRRSVWDLRQPVVESGGLAATLEETAAQLGHGATAKLSVTVNGSARPLPALIEHHLMRIATETIANALRHAGASRIAVELGYEPEAVRLAVADDGCGFNAEQAAGYTVGHFGLIGIRERCRKIGGSFQIDSAPGRGTRINICVPADPRHRPGT